ncbi:hypothetical protein [Methanosphaera sp.]|jgi:hypothetical protein|uniref:hypothetical protein n=1 Tax=Methanosphaera sp. TaxID=2666342 RepID=UPI003D8A2EC7
MTRYSTLSTVISQIPSTIEGWIQKEIDEGILDDVETFITSYENEMELDTPAIWITQHEWTPVEEKPLADHYRIRIPFEFACIEYDEDLKQSELLAMNLVSRVIASILKHFRRYPKEHEFFKMIKINFRELYPNGTIAVESKQEMVSIAGVLLEFIIDVDWMKCLVTEDNDKKVIDLDKFDGKLSEVISGI